MNVVASFSGISVSNQAEAKAFYTEVLGLTLVDEQMGLRLSMPGGGELFVYEKPNHEPASFTVLNFVVDDIDAAVDELNTKGVQMQRFEAGPPQDEKGVARGKSVNMGPDIAWFTDPAGNILSVLQD